MPSSSTGIQRTSSPQPQSARSRTSQSSTSHSQRNYLQQPDYTYSNHTPDLSTDHHYSNGYSNGIVGGGGGGGGMNGSSHSSSYRPKSPSLQPHYSPHSLHHPHHSSPHEQGTLSTLLTQLYRTAQSTFKSSSSNPSSNSLNPNHLHLSSSDSPSTTTTLLNKLRPSASNGSSPHSSHTSPLPNTGKGFTIPSASTVGFILLCCLWYLSSALSSNTGKSILTRFRYPVTLTFVQFAFVSGYSLLVLAVRNRLGSSSGGGGGGGGGLNKRRGSMNTLQGWGVRKPTKNMFHGTFMMSLFQIAGHVFSSMAIARVPVSTVHTIKALSPLFTVLSYVALFGVRYSTPTYISLLPLTLGVMLACSFDLRANAIGFLCALGSTFIFVAQNIFSKKLLPKESSGGPEESKGLNGGSTGGGGKLDKMNLLFYSSGMAFFLMIPIWLYSDASSLFFSPSPLLEPSSTPQQIDAASTASLLFYFFLNGTVHFGQNLLAFSLLARTSPVTYSIASLVKRIAVICIAIVWFGQKIRGVQGVGMIMCFGGLWMYNRSKSSVEKGEKRRIAVEKRQGMELPTSLEDVKAMDSNSDSSTFDTPPPKSPRISDSSYNPYHPPPVAPPPPPPHTTNPTATTSTHETIQQAARNRQTSIPLQQHSHHHLVDHSSLQQNGGPPPLQPIPLGGGGGKGATSSSSSQIYPTSSSSVSPHHQPQFNGTTPIQVGYR